MPLARKRVHQLGIRWLCTTPTNEELIKERLTNTLAPNPTIQHLNQLIYSTKSLKEANKVHSQIVYMNCENDPRILTSLLKMYINLKSLAEARPIFDRMSTRRASEWTCMITAYAQTGHLHEAVHLFLRMQLEGVHPDSSTFKALLNSCSTVHMVKLVQEWIILCGFESDLVLCNTQIHIYGKFNSVSEAKKVFDKLTGKHNIISYTMMFTAYARNGCQKQSLALFRQMLQAGVLPDCVAFVAVLEACERLTDAMLVHTCITQSGYGGGLIVGNMLISVYARCGSLERARSVFEGIPSRDIISYNAMLAAYSQCAQGTEVMELYRSLKSESHLEPTVVTFIAVLDACSLLGLLTEGTKIHEEVVERGLEQDVMVGTSLLNMYAKCGCWENASKVFEQMPVRDTVTWTAVVTSANHCGFHREAIVLFQRMQLQGLKPNNITLITVLNSCAEIPAIKTGRVIHAWMVERRMESFAMGTTLVNMYGKCGCLRDALGVFKCLSGNDSGIWNALIKAYAQNGHSHKALELFKRMQHEGIQVDDITFVGVLAACSHAGLVKNGCEHYSSMIGDYGLVPAVEHYGCMTDLLGRVGWLEEAHRLVAKMDVTPNSVVLTCLLGACKIHGDLKRGKSTADSVIKVEQEYVSSSAPYAMLSSLVSTDHLLPV